MFSAYLVPRAFVRGFAAVHVLYGALSVSEVETCESVLDPNP